MNTKKKWAGRVATLAVATAIAAVPFLSTQSAEAATYYRTERTERRVMRTLTGRVVNDLAGSAFTLRTDNGRTVRVHLMGREPNRLGRRDRVRVTGFYRNGTFHASSWSILRNR